MRLLSLLLTCLLFGAAGAEKMDSFEWCAAPVEEAGGCCADDQDQPPDCLKNCCLEIDSVKMDFLAPERPHACFTSPPSLREAAYPARHADGADKVSRQEEHSPPVWNLTRSQARAVLQARLN